MCCAGWWRKHIEQFNYATHSVARMSISLFRMRSAEKKTCDTSRKREGCAGGAAFKALAEASPSSTSKKVIRKEVPSGRAHSKDDFAFPCAKEDTMNTRWDWTTTQIRF
jgi:hypothetical protein